MHRFMYFPWKRVARPRCGLLLEGLVTGGVEELASLAQKLCVKVLGAVCVGGWPAPVRYQVGEPSCTCVVVCGRLPRVGRRCCRVSFSCAAGQTCPRWFVRGPASGHPRRGFLGRLVWFVEIWRRYPLPVCSAIPVLDPNVSVCVNASHLVPGCSRAVDPGTRVGGGLGD